MPFLPLSNSCFPKHSYILSLLYNPPNVVDWGDGFETYLLSPQLLHRNKAFFRGNTRFLSDRLFAQWSTGPRSTLWYFGNSFMEKIPHQGEELYNMSLKNLDGLEGKVSIKGPSGQHGRLPSSQRWNNLSIKNNDAIG